MCNKEIQNKLNNDYLYLEDKFGLNKVGTKGIQEYCKNQEAYVPNTLTFKDVEKYFDKS